MTLRVVQGGAADDAVLRLDTISARYGSGCSACRPGGASRDAHRCPACGTVTACREVSIDVRAGETLGIVGESGSGKTTALLCAALDAVPDDGRVLFGGEDVTGVTGSRRRRLRAQGIGIVYQRAQQGLDLEVSAGGNIGSRLLSVGWRSYAEVRGRAAALVEATELPLDRIDVPAGHFSGGMRQRVQLAKSMAAQPRLLLLDEPTSGLDVSVQARILDLVRRLQRETGVAMVIVSHDLGVIRMLAERLVVMRRGRVVESGLTDQLLEDPHDAYTQLLVSARLP